MKKLFVAVAESSGDKFASQILTGVDNLYIEGIGGEYLLKDVLKNSLMPLQNLSVMGFIEVLKKAFKLKAIIKKVAQYIIDNNFDYVLSVDSYSFGIRIAEIVKKHKPNIKFIQVVAPSVWLYGENRARKVAKYYEKLFCLLPFEPDFFTKYDLDAEFIGYHALYFQSNLKNIPKKRSICITLGSRHFEIDNNIPVLKTVVQKLSEKYDLDFYFPCLSHTIDEVKTHFNKKNHIVFQGQHKVLYDLVIAKSGTNTMEFAVNKEPMIVYYKVGKISELVLRLKAKNFKYANLINIVANKEIIPEFLQENFSVDNLLKTSIDLLDNQEKCVNQTHLCSQVLEKLACPVKEKAPADIVKDYLLRL